MLRIFLCCIILCSCASKQQRFTGGAVAADHILASNAGVTILEKGGNAVDAAVATSFALSVVRPFSCGIGGGGFMLIDSPDMDPIALNYRETAPSSMHREFYATNSSHFGGTAVGVPGTVAGLLAAHERFGILPLEVVMAPAIRLARAGFDTDQPFQLALQSVQRSLVSNPEFVHLEPRFQDTYATSTHIQLHGQAIVLEKIAEEGKRGFYEGDVANAIVQATGNHITLEDLQSYTPRWETPVLAYEHGGLQVYSMPPPSSGGVAIGQILRILDELGAFELDRNSVKYNHLLIEAMKHAFADRAKHMADPTFATVPIDALLDDQYLQSLAQQVDETKTQSLEVYGSAPQVKDDDGTSHFCVVDAEGMAVSTTETINTSFGSLVIVEPYDFPLNNEMDDFSSLEGANIYGLEQSDQNLPEAGKRPISSMTPVILSVDNTPILLLGASGGPRIISSVVQVLINSHWYKDSPVAAIDQPRVHHQWKPNKVYVEDFSTGTLPLQAIESLGHERASRSHIGVVQMIEVDGRWILPACDPRKGGRPAGVNK